MAAERLSMRHVREILRYRFAEGLGHKAISYRVGAAPSTVRETLRRASVAGLGWPLGEEINDAVLEGLLYKAAGTKTGHRRAPEPDWAFVHRELKRKHVTLQILWDEYIERHPDGYRYSRFCDLYRGWAANLPVTMRQNHGAGEKLFVDYAGDTVPVVIDRLTGKTRAAHLFVAVLGAASLSHAEARWGETPADWLECHVHTLEAIGGVPALLIPDNAKVAVIKACLYDPQVNRSYAEMAAHYGSAVLPVRPRRPRDKAKVEAAVRIVERWLLGRLRHRIFYGLAEVNAAIGELLTELNDRRVLRRVGRTRRQLFEEIDQPALEPLPVERYVYAEWRICRAGLDYHVEIDRHYYSVPWRFARAGRSPHHRQHRRAVPQGRADRRTSAFKRQRQAHHRARAHAVGAPALRRLDDRADQPGSLRHRLRRGAARREDPGRAAASRAGLPRLSGHHPPGQGLWPGKGQRCLRAGSGDWRADLWLRALHPRQPPRPGVGAAHRVGQAHRPSQHPRSPLLPLRGE